MSSHVADDLGAYVLGNLAPEEERGVRLHLETCSECREALARVQGATELLDSARLAADPPDGLEERILTAVGHEPVRPGRTRRAIMAVLASLLLGASSFAVGLALGRLSPAVSDPDQVVPMAGSAGASGTARVYALQTGARRIELTVGGLPDLPPGVAWDVFFADTRGNRRSAGSFLAGSGSSSTTVQLTVGAGSARFTTLVVNRSDAAPTDPPVLAGNLEP